MEALNTEPQRDPASDQGEDVTTAFAAHPPIPAAPDGGEDVTHLVSPVASSAAQPADQGEDVTHLVSSKPTLGQQLFPNGVVPAIADAATLVTGMNAPWAMGAMSTLGYDANPANVNPDVLETSKGITKALEPVRNFISPAVDSIEAFAREYIQPAEETIKNGLSDAAHIMQYPMSIFNTPHNLVTGNAMRIIDPTMMANMREEQAQDPWKTDFGKHIDEISPPIWLGSDKVLPLIKEKFRELGADPTAPILSLPGILNQIGSATALVGSVAADVVTDPLTWTEFLAPAEVYKAAVRAGDTIKAIDGVNSAEKILDNGRSVWFGVNGDIRMSDPAIKLVESADKNLVKVKLPLLPAVTIKGQAVQDYIRGMQAQVEASDAGRAIRSFSNQTTSPGFNMARNQQDFTVGMTQMYAKWIDESASFATRGQNLTKDVSQYAEMSAIHGPDGAAKIAAFKGMKLTPEEVEMANELGERCATWRADGNLMYSHLTGEKIPDYKLTDERVQDFFTKNPKVKDAIDGLVAKSPSMAPYLFDNNAAVARMRNPQWVLDMQALGKDVGEGEKILDKAIAGAGLKEVADSSKQRGPLSAWAYEFSQRQITGLDTSYYDPDLLRVTKANFADLIATGANQKFAEYVRNTSLTWEEVNNKVNEAKIQYALGPVDDETRRLALMDPKKDFKQVKVESLQRLQILGGKNTGDSIADVARTNVLTKKPLYQETSVADYLNNRYTSVDTGTAVGWFNTQVAKSYLTSPARAMPRLYATMGAYLMNGGGIGALAETLASRFRSPDELSQIWAAGGLRHDLTKSYSVTRQMIQDSNLYTAPGAFAAVTDSQRMLLNHGDKAILEMENTMQKIQNMGLGVKDSAKAAVEFANNNPIARKVRDLVNGFENLPKEALFRQGVLRDGMSIEQSFDKVSKGMLDFRFQPNNNSLGNYMLFGNYHAQNLARLPFMICKNPWVPGLVDSDRGAIKRAIDGSYGVKPSQVEGLQRLVGPIPLETSYAGFLPGAGSVMRDPEQANIILSRITSALLGKMPDDTMINQAMHKTPEGFQVLVNLPSELGAAKLFAAPLAQATAKVVNGQSLIPMAGGQFGMAPPILRALVVAMGYDPVTGKQLVDSDHVIDALSKSVNPYHMPNFWNIFNAAVDTASKAQHESLNNLFENPTYRAAMRLVGGSVLGTIYDKEKPGKAQLAAIVDTFTLGLFRLSQPEVQFQMQVKSNLSELDQKFKDLSSMAKSLDPAVREVAKKNFMNQIMPITKDLKNMVKFHTAYKNATQQIRLNKSLHGELAFPTELPDIMPSNDTLFPKDDDNEGDGNDKTN